MTNARWFCISVLQLTSNKVFPPSFLSSHAPQYWHKIRNRWPWQFRREQVKHYRSWYLCEWCLSNVENILRWAPITGNFFFGYTIIGKSLQQIKRRNNSYLSTHRGNLPFIHNSFGDYIRQWTSKSVKTCDKKISTDSPESKLLTHSCIPAPPTACPTPRDNMPRGS